MENKKPKVLVKDVFIAAFMFFGGILIGIGTNWQTGLGVGLVMLAFAGILEW
jgi:hypothetical protein